MLGCGPESDNEIIDRKGVKFREKLDDLEWGFNLGKRENKEIREKPSKFNGRSRTCFIIE